MSLVVALRTRLLSQDLAETTVETRGFRVARSATRERIEGIGRAFMKGYHATLADSRPEAIARELDPMDDLYRGFAYEGAAMSLSILDRMTPWSAKRFQRFLDGPGDAHLYMAYVGAGWALARTTLFSMARLLGKYPAIWRPLIVDGYGFHEGYFRPDRYYPVQGTPRKLRNPAWLPSFDQGLGRALWFVEGGDPERIQQVIDAFPSARRPNFWAGIGLAATYAGGVPREVLAAVRERAGDHAGWLAQGCGFAVKARFRAENPVPHNLLACEVFCGMPVATVVAHVDRIRATLDDNDPGAYESWRIQIRDALTASPEPPAWTRRLHAVLRDRGAETALLFAGGGDRDRRRGELKTLLAPRAGTISRRGDGKPEAERGAVSFAHGDTISMAVWGEGPQACDLETVSAREDQQWRDMLGARGERLRDFLIEEGEHGDVAGTRVWTAIECLTKAGLPTETPLTVATHAEDGTVVFRAGSLEIVTVAGREAIAAVLCAPVAVPTEGV